MNYAIFQQWLLGRIDDLVEFGVPRDEAEHIVKYVEVAGLSAELEARCESQFLLDLQRNGSTVLADRHNCSPQSIRKKRMKLLQKRSDRLRARLL